MNFDWITWSFWTFGLALLLYWCFHTWREFKALFNRNKSKGKEPRGEQQ